MGHFSSLVYIAASEPFPVGKVTLILNSNKSTVVQLLKLQSNIVVNFFTYSSTENNLNIQNLSGNDFI